MNEKAYSLRRLLILIFFVFILAAPVLYLSTDFLVEISWHDSLGFLTYYLMRIGYRDIIALVITVIQGCFIFLNFTLIPVLFKFKPASLFPKPSLRHNLSCLLFRPSIRLFFISAIIFTIPILTPIYLYWEGFLLFFFNAGSNLTDPVFGRDVSFYLFSYPLIKQIQSEMLLVFSLLFATIAVAYWLVNRQLTGGKKTFPGGVRIHLTLLIGAIIAIQAWSIWLERFDILYVERHLPVFFGPGFVEINFQLPLIWLNYLFFIGMAAATIFYLYTRRGIRALLGCALIYWSMTAIKHTLWVPELIDQIYVDPNPVTAERKNIAYNIDATQQAFGLNQIESVEYPVKTDPVRINPQAIADVLENIPLWDNELLMAGFDQLQAVRPFFDFYDVAVDRYQIEGRNYQVNVAARELQLNKLPDAARTWNNRHFVYTHGYGLVMAPSLQQANQPMRWLIKNLNNQSEYPQLSITQPEIFYGLADYDYAIVPNDAPIPQVDDSSFQMTTDYQGNGGIDISTLFRRTTLAGYFQDFDMLLTTNMTPKSRILFRRNILEKIKILTPFLTIDANPYPVVVNHKIYWIADAYTTSNLFPAASRYQFPIDNETASEPINYIRNSVKIIVDAYTGAITFYLIDSNDPVAMTYRRIYPTLFKDANEIPEAFINHLSYPSKLFALQMAVYARYHPNNPDIYYQQSEAMTFPEIKGDKVLPYYLTLAPETGTKTGHSDEYKFLLLSPLSQIGRDNLSIIAMAGCIKAVDCQTNYSADIMVYKFPINQQIEGPAQMTGLIDQDPEISRQLSLWEKRGATVIRGRMIIVPVDGSLLYVQPVYTTSTGNTGFPQLARIIVAMNKVAAMDVSVEQAFAKLREKLGI